MEAWKLLQSRGWAGYEVTHDARGDGFFFCWHWRPLYPISACRLSSLGIVVVVVASCDRW
jgi:hypothetical protein